MRLFVALTLSDSTRKSLEELCNDLRLHVKAGNFTLSENFHLTLAFLGECDPRQAAAAAQAVEALCFAPFAITIAGYGHFDRGRPNLLFGQLQNDSGYRRLGQLQAALSSSLSVKGFVLEQRKFRPHITLARQVVWQDGFSSADFFGQHHPTITEPVSAITLMQSSRIDGKLTYTPLTPRKKGDRYDPTP